MSLLRKSDLRDLYNKKSTSSEHYISINKSYDETFDVFLSHSYSDKELIFGVKYFLENKGFTVYIDWIDDAELDRSAVNVETADRLRKRMKQCKTLLFATSSNSINSKWMPWECGYFDALNGKVAILPIVDDFCTKFDGQEYLSLYPYVDFTGVLWVNNGPSDYIRFSEWLK